MNLAGQKREISAPLDILLSAIPLAALVVDPEDRIHSCNALAQEAFGATILGRNLAMVLRNPDLLESIAESRSDLVPRQVTLRQSDDAQYLAQITALPQEKGAAALLCVFRDVTAESKHEEMRRDFVANVSHELRTPLTAMTGFIETLQGPAKDDAKARIRFLDIMAKEAERMNRLVRDLLHLSKVESAERMRPRDEVDLAAILTNAAATLRLVSAARGVRLVLDLPKTGTKLRGDSDQLLQVFLNLLENAIKYGASGGEVQVTSRVVELSRGKMLCISVADQGEGIAPEHLPRLTERFYRVDSHRSRAEGGTGLGLAIVKHILNRHRGFLRVESRKGEGSVFSVSLPLEAG